MFRVRFATVTKREKYRLYALCIPAVAGMVVAAIKILPELFIDAKPESGLGVPEQKQSTGDHSPAIIARDNTTITIHSPTTSTTKDGVNSSEAEKWNLLRERYKKIRKTLDEQESKTGKKEEFLAFRQEVEKHMEILEAAMAKRESILHHDSTKTLVRLMDSIEAKEILPPETREFIHSNIEKTIKLRP